MSNSWFQFKQFTVHQERSAMKVSTDACIQGAWTPLAPEVKTVLDIGTGTGLLALMLSQRQNRLVIDAAEIEPAAYQQAKQNMDNSPFSEGIHVHHTDIRYWDKPSKYDLLICNPPFFSNSLRSTDTQRRLARHDDSFSREDMALAIKRLMNPEGSASILLPATEQQDWETLLHLHQLQLQQRLLIRPYAHSKVNRVVSICNSSGRTAPDEELVIYRQPGQYTASFAALMQPFYLGL